MKSQMEMIKEHLEAGHTLTPLSALAHFGCLRLGARIYDLKRNGMTIYSHLICHKRHRFAEYSLKPFND